MTTPTLSERADACLAALDEPGRAIARRVLLRLVSFEDGRAAARRQQPLSALQGSGDPVRTAEVVRHLAGARLIRIEGDEASPEARIEARIELADPSLVTAWPTLHGWLDSHGRTEQLRRRLETDAAAWQRTASGPRDAGLLDGSQLGELAGWMTSDARHDLGVSDVAESYIAASRAATRGHWWPASTGTVLAILLMLLILATPIILLFIVVLTAGVIHRLG